MRLVATVLGSPDPRTLAAFYSRLLSWEIKANEPDWATVRPDSGAGLSIQLETDHVRPVWPSGPGDQQMQAHLDIQVDDLAAGVEFARSCGATEAEFQPQEDVRVMFDPDGHPFCLFVQ